MNIKHSSESSEWWTPPHIIAMVKEVFGGQIDFDPASCEGADKVVGAEYYLAGEGDPTNCDWGEAGYCKLSIFLNPPGGKYSNRSAQAVWWSRLMEMRLSEKGEFQFGHAIFLGFSVEVLQTAQSSGGVSPLEFPICVPARRIRFLKSDGGRLVLDDEGEPVRGFPSHANVIVYVPGSIDATDKFIEVFSALGACKR